jgi:hypothetical protein
MRSHFDERQCRKWWEFYVWCNCSSDWAWISISVTAFNKIKVTLLTRMEKWRSEYKIRTYWFRGQWCEKSSLGRVECVREVGNFKTFFPENRGTLLTIRNIWQWSLSFISTFSVSFMTFFPFIYLCLYQLPALLALVEQSPRRAGSHSASEEIFYP